MLGFDVNTVSGLVSVSDERRTKYAARVKDFLAKHPAGSKVDLRELSARRTELIGKLQFVSASRTPRQNLFFFQFFGSVFEKKPGFLSFFDFTYTEIRTPDARLEGEYVSHYTI